jgi:hypothetical protein
METMELPLGRRTNLSRDVVRQTKGQGSGEQNDPQMTPMKPLALMLRGGAKVGKHTPGWLPHGSPRKRPVGCRTAHPEKDRLAAARLTRKKALRLPAVLATAKQKKKYLALRRSKS